MTEFVLVSCSKSKLTGTHRGEDLYDPSDIFGKRRTFAEREGVHWGILSAKHGYLRSWEAVEDYERHISDRTPVWGAFVLDDLLTDLEFYDVDQVTVLAGKRYVDPLVPELEAHGYDVLDYNRGLRPGERKRALKEANAPGEQETLVTDGGTEDGRGDTHCAICGEPVEGGETHPEGEVHAECAAHDGTDVLPDGGRPLTEAECGSCGFRDRKTNFDERGMDTACPACGSTDVEEVDDGE